MWQLLITGIFFCISLPAQADLIVDVRVQLAQNSFSGAESELRTYKAQHGTTPEYLEAASWMARAYASNGQWDQAATYARDIGQDCERQLTAYKSKLDADPHLPIALGAAYEISRRGWRKKGSTRKQSAYCVRLWRVMETHPFKRGCKKTSTCSL